ALPATVAAKRRNRLRVVIPLPLSVIPAVVPPPVPAIPAVVERRVVERSGVGGVRDEGRIAIAKVVHFGVRVVRMEVDGGHAERTQVVEVAGGPRDGGERAGGGDAGAACLDGVGAEEAVAHVAEGGVGRGRDAAAAG